MSGELYGALIEAVQAVENATNSTVTLDGSSPAYKEFAKRVEVGWGRGCRCHADRCTSVSLSAGGLGWGWGCRAGMGGERPTRALYYGSRYIVWPHHLSFAQDANNPDVRRGKAELIGEFARWTAVLCRSPFASNRVLPGVR